MDVLRITPWRPSQPIHLNVDVEFDPGMVGKGVLVCCMMSLRKWSITLECFFFFRAKISTYQGGLVGQVTGE